MKMDRKSTAGAYRDSPKPIDREFHFLKGKRFLQSREFLKVLEVRFYTIIATENWAIETEGDQ